jgi:division protein CdvB (Snf7/Vps24/ESCRT-III family)
MSAIISRLFQVFGFGAQQETPRESIDKLLVKLELLEDKVAEIRYRFERRSRELWETTIRLLRRNEKTRATIYAGEIVQVRNIIKLIYGLENMIIMTKERLRTVKDVKEVGQALMVFGTALEEIREHARAIYPNLNVFFDELSRNVKSMIVETSMSTGFVEHIDPVVVSQEAQTLLNEALRRAEEEVKSEFPEPPLDTVVKLEPARQAVAVGAAAGAGTEGKEAPTGTAGSGLASYAGGPRRSMEEVEQLVLKYIRSNGGILDIKEFTTRYGVSKNEVLQAIHRLAEKGLIALA